MESYLSLIWAAIIGLAVAMLEPVYCSRSRRPIVSAIR
jgi:hypothetical protein